MPALATGATVTTVLLVGGHESHGGAALGRYLGPGVDVVASLTRSAIDAALEGATPPACVVPMTFGRDSRLVADTARALQWASRHAPGRVVLAAPFGGQEHLVGWLRAAIGRHREPGTAVLVTAPTGGPFDDADLYRVARLAGQYRPDTLVEVALTGATPDVAVGVERCRRLGARRVVVVPASFTAPPQVPGAVDGGPLVSAAAVGEVLAARAAQSLRRLDHGDDGIAAGLRADHHYGYPHAHPGGI